MKIAVAPYVLRSRHSLSTRHGGGDRRGALLRVENHTWEGFADLHPWPELGDLPLEVQLNELRSGRRTPLLERALVHAELDGKARVVGRNLLDGLQIPASHFLITDIDQTGPERIVALEQDGFRMVKFKCGRDRSLELRRFNRLAEGWPQSVGIRLDFNASMDVSSAARYVEAMPEILRQQIEFVEDPFAYGVQEWTRWREQTGKAVALDRECHEMGDMQLGLNAGAFQFVVIKPAVQNPELMHEILSREERQGVGMIVTTYMDHPLGQMAAAFASACFATGPCGLLSHTVYEPTDFSEELRTEGPRLLPARGTGFGFDDLLRRQAWENLGC